MEPEFAIQMLEEAIVLAIKQFNRYAKIGVSERMDHTVSVLETLLNEAREAQERWEII